MKKEEKKKKMRVRIEEKGKRLNKEISKDIVRDFEIKSKKMIDEGVFSDSFWRELKKVKSR